MKTRISALMDGELDGYEAEEILRAMKREPELKHDWGRYQLIGDAMRDEAALDVDVMSRVMTALADEPVILAPQVRQAKDRVHPLMAMAATIAGVAIVAWVALSHPEAPVPERSMSLAASAANTPQRLVPVAAAAGGAQEKLQDYLLAHHAHAPTAAVATGARYVRTVSMQRNQP